MNIVIMHQLVLLDTERLHSKACCLQQSPFANNSKTGATKKTLFPSHIIQRRCSQDENIDATDVFVLLFISWPADCQKITDRYMDVDFAGRLYRSDWDRFKNWTIVVYNSLLPNNYSSA